MNQNRVFSFLKTYRVLQVSMMGTPLKTYSKRLPKWGSMRNGDIFAQKMKAHPISVNDGSAWPTPRSSVVNNDTTQASIVNGRIQRNGQDYGLSLPAAVQQWPTPAATEVELARRPAVDAYVTSTGTVRRRNSDGGNSHLGLEHTVTHWATPTVQDGENNAPPSQYERNSLPLNAQAGEVGQKLNPDWVETLMGLPIGWTDLSLILPAPVNLNSTSNLPEPQIEPTTEPPV